MARRIKRFFVFLLFSMFFSLLSGRISVNKQSQNDTKVSGVNKKGTVWSLNAAMASVDDPDDPCYNSDDVCCGADD